MDLNLIEIELKKRLEFPYKWGMRQNNFYNGKTNFIYKIRNFNELLEYIEDNFKKTDDFEKIFNYALNRWFNFWSAIAIENIFCSLPNVTPARNKDRLVDFYIQGINSIIKQLYILLVMKYLLQRR